MPAEKPFCSHCVFIVPVCRLETDCQRAPMLPMIRGSYRGSSQNATLLLWKRGSTQCTSMPKKRRLCFGGDSSVAQSREQSHEPTIRGFGVDVFIVSNRAMAIPSQ